MGQKESQPAPASGSNSSPNPTGEVKCEYHTEPFSHTNRTKLKPGTMISIYDCMLIGSYGDKYSDNIKDAVIPKLPEKPMPENEKPSGKFLRGVSVDLELIQDMIRNDPRKHLAYVLPDVPGAQRSVTDYLAKIEKLLKESNKNGGG